MEANEKDGEESREVVEVEGLLLLSEEEDEGPRRAC